MKTRSEIIGNFPSSATESLRFYFWYYVPLGGLEFESVGFLNEKRGLINVRQEVPLSLISTTWIAELDFETFVSVIEKIKRKCAIFGPGYGKYGKMSFNIKDPAEMCLLLCDEDGERFIRVEGFHASEQVTQLVADVVKLVNAFK